MPRHHRVTLPGFPHHVTHRVNRRDDIFQDEADHRFYLDMLADYTVRYDVRVNSYCLITNHIHLISVPENRTALSGCLRDLHGRYAHYFNRK